MGSYGIGVSRLVGGIIEASHDENGHHLAGSGGAVRRSA
jgi:prolyl-tRNA synthetase